MMTRLLIALTTLMLAPAQLWAQTQPPPTVSRTTLATARAELEAVLAEAGKLDDKLAIINVKARSAALVSLSDPVRSEMLFREVWEFAKGQTDKDFDREQALALILKYIFQRNPKLAKTLLAEMPKNDGAAANARATSSDPGLNRKTKLASQLVDDNPRAASEILEQTLSNGITPSGLNTLLRLRDRDALLSDFVVGRAMDGLRAQPDVVSLAGLHLLSAYLFPEGNNAESSSSLQSLQIQYFSTTYDVLRASLAQSEAVLIKDLHYTKADLNLRALYQARMALTLAALAPSYQPLLAAELNTLANRLGPRLPDRVAQTAKLTSARLSGNQTPPDNPELAIPLAIQSGDFEEASRLIDDLKNDDLKKQYSQVLAKAEARALLAKSDVLGALIRIRKVEDENARLAFYLEAIKAAQKKHDDTLCRTVIDEARALIPSKDRNGLHVRALLALASQLTLMSTDEAVIFLDAAVVAMNSLPKRSEEPGTQKTPMELAWAEINDPAALSELPEFAHAFATIGVIDLERTIIEARKIGVKSAQLVARLEAVGEVMRIEARRPKPKAVTRAASNSGK